MRNKILSPMIHLFTLIFLSCSSNTSNTHILSQIDSSIIQVNGTLINSNKNILESLKLKTADVRRQHKAEQWLPIALKVDSVAENLLRFIDDLKTSMKERRGTESLKNFIDEGRGRMLFQKILHFKTRIIAVDSASNNRDWPAFLNSSEESTTNAGAFLQQLQSSSQAEVETFLSALQSDILRNEQQYLLYCHNATASTGDHYETFEAIVGQNAQILEAGNELEITAGIGRFSKEKTPKISIGGKPLPLNEKGLVVYKVKTSKRIGSHSIPVKFQFVDQDGKSQERQFTVEYQVVREVTKQ